MTFKKGEVTNPKGSPIIRELVKTGPRTKEGKLRQVFKNPLIGRQLTKVAKTTKYWMRCDRCALGPKDIVRTINGKKTTITQNAMCKYWKAGSKKCQIPFEDWKGQMLTYFQNDLENIRADMLMQDIALQQHFYAQHNAKMDLATDGKVKDDTLKWFDSSASNVEKIHKMLHGEKRQVEMSGSIGVATLNISDILNFEDEEVNKMSEEEEKPVEEKVEEQPEASVEEAAPEEAPAEEPAEEASVEEPAAEEKPAE